MLGVGDLFTIVCLAEEPKIENNLHIRKCYQKRKKIECILKSFKTQSHLLKTNMMTQNKRPRQVFSIVFQTRAIEYFRC